MQKRFISGILMMSGLLCVGCQGMENIPVSTKIPTVTAQVAPVVQPKLEPKKVSNTMDASASEWTPPPSTEFNGCTDDCNPWYSQHYRTEIDNKKIDLDIYIESKKKVYLSNEVVKTLHDEGYFKRHATGGDTDAVAEFMVRLKYSEGDSHPVAYLEYFDEKSRTSKSLRPDVQSLELKLKQFSDLVKTAVKNGEVAVPR